MTIKALENRRSRLFIELYNYRSTWVALDEQQRSDYIDKVVGSINQLEGIGIDIIGYGRNAPSTSQCAPYEFFCIYRVPASETQHVLEVEIAKSGWYDFFDQVNLSGEAVPYIDQLSNHVTGIMGHAMIKVEDR